MVPVALANVTVMVHLPGAPLAAATEPVCPLSAPEYTSTPAASAMTSPSVPAVMALERSTVAAGPEFCQGYEKTAGAVLHAGELQLEAVGYVRDLR